MTPRMIDALARLSAACNPDTDTLLEYVVQLVGDCFDGSMAMVNLVRDDRLVFRAVANRVPALDNVESLPIEDSICVHCHRSKRPLVIQDAAADPAFRRNPVVCLGIRRYAAVPILDCHGQSLGTVCFLDDRVDKVITDDDIRFLAIVAMRASSEIEREFTIRDRERQQQAFCDALQAANRRMEAAATEKRRFITMVLHDVGHPLTAIKASLFLAAQRSNPHPMMLQELQTITCQVDSISRFVQSLRLIDEIDRDSAVLCLADVAPSRLIGECLAVLAPLAAHYCLRLESHVDRELGRRRLDSDKISHILYNLVGNALRFTPAGVVCVSAGPLPGNAWWLEVHDTGRGMETSRAPLQRDDGGSRISVGSSDGSGMGLTIVRRICDLLEAEMEVKSSTGYGTSIRIEFVARCSAGSLSRFAAADRAIGAS